MVDAKRKLHGVWSSRWTFIMAATGSAVGLGNIWKFPYIAGEYGGGAFVLVYLICIALLGVPIMIAEVMLGRRGRQSPIASMKDLALEAGSSGFWKVIGWMGVLAGFLILCFYSVIAGWALHYLVETASGNLQHITSETAGAAFDTLLQSKSTLMSYHSIFMLMTVGVVSLGVVKGLGVAVRTFMPLLFVLLLVLLGYGYQEGNFAAAVDFLFAPSWNELLYHDGKFSMEGVMVAMGHAFFTLSLGMGAIMAYGAYMPEGSSIGRTAFTVGLLDTVVALVAGLAIFPLVFASPALEPGAGPGLMFISLPVAFGNMEGGVIFGAVFFALVTLAAWSSAISLIEPGVAWLVDSKGFHRVSANALLGVLAWGGGIGVILSFNDYADSEFFFGKNFFNFLDYLTANIMLPLCGLLIALFVGWVMKRENVRQELDEERESLFNFWYRVLRFVSPVLVVLVFLYKFLA